VPVLEAVLVSLFSVNVYQSAINRPPCAQENAGEKKPLQDYSRNGLVFLAYHRD
jgi:hypothetical protein